MPSSDLIMAIAATAELCNKVFSPAAAQLFAADLDEYEEKEVIKALSRCRRDLKGPFTLEAVISRIDDGRPGVEEAWAILPQDEYKTVVWTDEMAKAYGVASPLLNIGDAIGARMAFKESYTKLCADARDQKQSVKWTASLGHDKNGRESALIDAMNKGRLSASHVQKLLPHHEISNETLALIDGVLKKNSVVSIGLGKSLSAAA